MKKQPLGAARLHNKGVSFWQRNPWEKKLAIGRARCSWVAHKKTSILEKLNEFKTYEGFVLLI